MEASVEDGNLRYGSEQLLNNCHPFQLGAIMEGSEGRHRRDGRFYFGRDDNWIFISGTAVDNAVPNHIDLRRRGDRPRVAIPKAIEQLLDGVSARTHFYAILARRPVRSLQRQFSDFPIPLNFSFP